MRSAADRIMVLLLVISTGGNGDGAETADPLQKTTSTRNEILTNSIGMKLKLIPPGEFLMGSPADEEDRNEDEQQHRVRITKPFYLGIHEITIGQFAEFIRSSGYKTEAEKKQGGYGYNDTKGRFEGPDQKYTWRNSGFPQQDEKYPVVNVSWNDAVEFSKWLSKKENREYRLPTEAEWEYACRAGTTTRFYSGNDTEGMRSIANSAGAMVPGEAEGGDLARRHRDGFIFPAPVGSFRANGFGLYDMHGNAWEWCQDWYDGYSCGGDPTNDPTGPATGSVRVIRGGSWINALENCRSAYRGWSPSEHWDSGLGFRVALNLTE